jgi:hypothetical protein
MTAVARLLLVPLALLLGGPPLLLAGAKEFPYESLGSIDVSTGESSIFMMNGTRECRALSQPTASPARRRSCCHSGALPQRFVA